MSDTPEDNPGGYDRVVIRLHDEFGGVHRRDTITRCVGAARQGARDVTGDAAPDLVERIARKHLQVLALVAAEHG